MQHIFTFFSQHWQLIDLFARGGGGGSGGGSGGGGGGSGLELIALIGYLPAHYVTSKLYRYKSAAAAIIAGSLTGFAVTIASIALIKGWGFVVGIGAITGVYSGTHNWMGRIGQKIKRSKSVMTYAATKDGVWKEAEIRGRISTVFYDFQKDWASFNLDNMRTYMSARYFQHVSLMLTALQQMGRQNAMGDIKLKSYEVIEAVDDRNDDDDNFRTYIKASAHDMLIDTVTSTTLYTDNSTFEEFWRFDREGDEWKLDGIDQATASSYSRVPALNSFAEQNGMFYSADMGWLLMPQRGELFGKANFKKSDINNHVIGQWNGHIVQLYTYIPFKAKKRADNYLIGQINLPKSYGGIIIKRKSGWSWAARTPRGYRGVTLEWPDFNKRYKVYATDMDKVTSFELFNPAYMVKLFDLNLPINIEVVDNVVYLYSLVSAAETRYKEMLEVLQGAYKELYM